MLLPGQGERLGALMREHLSGLELVVNEGTWSRTLTVWVRRPDGKILAEVEQDEKAIGILGDLWADRVAADLLAQLQTRQVAA